MNTVQFALEAKRLEEDAGFLFSISSSRFEFWLRSRLIQVTAVAHVHAGTSYSPDCISKRSKFFWILFDVVVFCRAEFSSRLIFCKGMKAFRPHQENNDAQKSKSQFSISIFFVLFQANPSVKVGADQTIIQTTGLPFFEEELIS